MRLMWHKKEDAKFDDADLPLNRLANTIIHAALKARASDLHLEPCRENFVVRHRIDGFLNEDFVIPKYIQADLTARYRELAGLEPQSAGLPQEGEFRLRFGDRLFTVRMASLPTIYGEKLVFRFVDHTPDVLRYDHLGIDAPLQERLEKVVREQGGMLLFSGPMGCGKTTTQRSLLYHLASEHKNCFIIGENFGSELPHTTSIAIRPHERMTVIDALKAISREQPDIVMINEIHDASVWKAAIDLAHSGTLVFAAICTIDTAGALRRLLDMGLSPSSVAYGVSGVLGQSLVRRPCHRCLHSEETDRNLLYQFGLVHSEIGMPRLVKAVGCEHCSQTGYRGRIGIFEYLPQSDETVYALTTLSGIPLRDALQSVRFQTFRHDAAVKLMEGQTTLEEVHRVFGNTLNLI